MRGPLLARMRLAGQTVVLSVRSPVFASGATVPLRVALRNDGYWEKVLFNDLKSRFFGSGQYRHSGISKSIASEMLMCKAFLAGQREESSSDKIFQGVVGHKVAIKILTEALNSNRTTQTFLFHGPSGVGKMMVAERFAAALMGKGPGEHRTTSDYHCQDRGGAVGVDDARELVNFLSHSAWGPRKVAVLRGDRMTEPAANALLRTFEQRLGNSVVIIVAEDTNSLPKTLISRCVRVPFRPLSPQETTWVFAQLALEAPYLSPIRAALEVGVEGGPGLPAAPPVRPRGRSARVDYIWAGLAEAVLEMGRGRPGFVIEAWQALQKVPEDVLLALEALPLAEKKGNLSLIVSQIIKCNRRNQLWLLRAMMYWKPVIPAVKLPRKKLGEKPRKTRGGERARELPAKELMERLDILEKALNDLIAKRRDEDLWTDALNDLARGRSTREAY